MVYAASQLLSNAVSFAPDKHTCPSMDPSCIEVRAKVWLFRGKDLKRTNCRLLAFLQTKNTVSAVLVSSLFVSKRVGYEQCQETSEDVILCASTCYGILLLSFRSIRAWNTSTRTMTRCQTISSARCIRYALCLGEIRGLFDSYALTLPRMNTMATRI